MRNDENDFSLLLFNNTSFTFSVINLTYICAHKHEKEMCGLQPRDGKLKLKWFHVTSSFSVLNTIDMNYYVLSIQ